MNAFVADMNAGSHSTPVAANPNGQRPITLDELARAVSENALLNTQVDQKLAARLIETREELKATQEALNTLRRQFEQFLHGIEQVLVLTRLQAQRPNEGLVIAPDAVIGAGSRKG